jgi:hypothetical protein
MATNNQTAETASSSPARKSSVRKSRSSRPAARKRRNVSSARKAAVGSTRSRASKASGSRAKSRSFDASGLMRQGRQAFNDAYNQVASTTRAIPKAARRMGNGANRESLVRMIEDRPLMLGAVGLGIGMMLAAIIPTMNMMNRGGNRSGSRNRRR